MHALFPQEIKKHILIFRTYFDAADVLGWYEIVYEDEYREIIPIQYGVNILEWNPGGEKSLNKLKVKQEHRKKLIAMKPMQLLFF